MSSTLSLPLLPKTAASQLWLQRLFDLTLAGPGLLAFSPILLVAAVLVKLSSPGPVFYRAQRVGRQGRLFQLYKFRTMVVGADRDGPGITTASDQRITPIGRWLRRTKVDELPQLFNIVAGNMSVVGPRPEDPRYVALYTPEQRQLLEALPGLTSPASLSYRNEEALLTGPDWETRYVQEVMPHKLAIELDYLKHRTFFTDFVILLRTFRTLIP